MKKLMFLGLFACIIALQSCVTVIYTSPIPDNPLIKEVTSTGPIEINLVDELKEVHTDDGTACILKKITNANALVNTSGLFEGWRTYPDSIQYRKILEITKNQVIDINTTWGLAEIGKRIAFAFQYPKIMPHADSQTIFAFIKDGSGAEMVMIARLDSDGKHYRFSMKSLDHNYANKGSMVVNHPVRKS